MEDEEGLQHGEEDEDCAPADEDDASPVDVDSQHHEDDAHNLYDDGEGDDVGLEVVPHDAGFDPWAVLPSVVVAGVFEDYFLGEVAGGL